MVGNPKVYSPSAM